MNTKQWFLDRIGDRVYRKKTTCDCECCTRVAKEGIVVKNTGHAQYPSDVSAEMGVEYFDEPIPNRG